MILLRHAETVFNVVFGATRQDPGVHDPALTPRGRAQARAAAETLRGEDVRRVIASPYRRALETADIVARTLNIPVTVEALVRERAKFSCDIGTRRAELSLLWRELAFDHLEDVWWCEDEEPEDELAARCREFCRTMCAAADWPHVAVVTHWGVIRALTGRAVKNAEHLRFDPTAMR